MKLIFFGLAILVSNLPQALTVPGSAPAAPRQASVTAPQPATFFEEDDPKVIWSGVWSTKPLAAHSAGSAKLAMDAGAQATFTFNGTGVTWIGYQDQWSGVAKVFVDGTFKAMVDTFSPDAKPRARLFTIGDLEPGTHTLTIEVTGTHNAPSTASWVWVDAFGVSQTARAVRNNSNAVMPTRMYPLPAGGVGSRRNATKSSLPQNEGREEQRDRATTFEGNWATNQLPAHRDGSARLTMDPSSRATFVFEGTGVKWIGYRDEWSGIADVILDGRVLASVDTYQTPAKARAVLYAIDGLPHGTHTLVIQPTGRHRQGSGGAWIWVDAFSITP